MSVAERLTIGRDETAKLRRGREVRHYSPWAPYVFLAPYLIFFVVFVLFAAIYGIWISLHDYDYLIPNKPWVGFQNYTNLFKSGSRDAGDFWQSMGATGIFTVASVPFLVTIPLLIALLLNRKIPGRTFF